MCSIADQCTDRGSGQGVTGATRRDSLVIPGIGHWLAEQAPVVDGVLFLESSPYITGEVLHIDGGQIAGR